MSQTLSPQDTTTRKVIVIVAAIAGLTTDSIKPTDELVEDIHLGDTELLDLEIAIEDEFTFSKSLPVFISDDWKTVQDIINYLENLNAGGAQ